VVARDSFLQRWDAHNQSAVDRASSEYNSEVGKRTMEVAQRAATRHRRSDRSVEVSGKRLWVKIRPRFAPSRDAPPNVELWRWLLWGLPARLLRRAIAPDEWILRLYEVKHWPTARAERLLLKENIQGDDAAERRIDEVAESLTEGSLDLG
jgi:hypothetical protein